MLPRPMTNEQLQKLRDEAKRFGRGLTDAEAQWALTDGPRKYFVCQLTDLYWDARIMLKAKEELGGIFFAPTEPPAIRVSKRTDGKFWLLDGYHRVAAALKLRKTSIAACHV